MKTLHKSTFALALFLIFSLAISAQDLSKYRTFSLGTRLSDLSKQVNETQADVTVVHKTPALIEEMTWWPVPAGTTTGHSEPVQEILFTFYNSSLYRIKATYSSASTEGMTAEDMVRALTVKYGAATLPAPVTAPIAEAYNNTAQTVASWQDTECSVTLSRSPLSGAFELVMLSKQLEGLARTAIAESIKQDHDDAPQMEIARAKKEADDLETMRQANVKAFRP